ncbi:hypothetical protein HO173_009031 [Letharia columbiana]|uniref:Uncharacterized protein n=1 Tax=Letharia columbiana TaxID=112416 RepID=A0A8H6FQD1_9LECA|nr:uncharacterized protein HO173_009031 [Letharia columbiana]KAF6232817.1 hypothetical protein HO173_009031 [Letharia columbiana]
MILWRIYALRQDSIKVASLDRDPPMKAPLISRSSSSSRAEREQEQEGAVAVAGAVAISAFGVYTESQLSRYARQNSMPPTLPNVEI